MDSPSIFGALGTHAVRVQLRYPAPKMLTTPRFCIRRAVELLLLVWNIFSNIFQTAIKDRTQFVQCLGFHVVVCPQAPDGLAVDTALFP